jgi:hypothetical protein
MQLHEAWCPIEEEINFYWNLSFILVLTKALKYFLSSPRWIQITSSH